ncbi:MAG: TetR/AcrR family transcriptional regulator [Proteobacteria bacterium]|nr:TetR/AcrR family transcriptional regulator [Desulfobacula sp.]MBU4133342.1 TetR/AcrR family transcriptional regulator [Pseudomonadota bacterium]
MLKKNGADKRIQILDALNTCLQNKPFDQTSIKEIAQAAGVNHGLLHYYFKSKEDILIQYIDYVIDHYTSMVQERFNDKALETIDKRKLVKEFFKFIHDRITLDRSLSMVFIEIWEIAVYNPAVKAKLQRAYQEWMDVLSDMLKPLCNDIDVSRRTSFAAVAFLEGMALFSIILDPDSKEFKKILSDFQSKMIDML